jgi:cytochrome c oxidase cbb3-type subunit 1
MWREYTPQGFLANSFVETVSAKHIENVIRTFGGLMYLSGVFIMFFNLWKTVRLPSVQEQAPVLTAAPAIQAAE